MPLFTSERVSLLGGVRVTRCWKAILIWIVLAVDRTGFGFRHGWLCWRAQLLELGASTSRNLRGLHFFFLSSPYSHRREILLDRKTPTSVWFAPRRTISCPGTIMVGLNPILATATRQAASTTLFASSSSQSVDTLPTGLRGLPLPSRLLLPHLQDRCWASTSSSVNPSNDPDVDSILQGLHSPAPQSFFALQRALQEYSLGIAMQTCGFLVKSEYVLVVRDHLGPVDRCYHPVEDWKIVPASEAFDQTRLRNWKPVPRPKGTLNTSQLANRALEFVVDASDRQEQIDQAAFNIMIDDVEKNLHITLGTDVRGRTAADTAFALGLAGVDREALYQSLVHITLLELIRVGKRPSRRAQDILHIVEKLAATGIKGECIESVYRLAAELLKDMGQQGVIVEALSTPGKFDLLSPRPLLWLWRFATKLRKPHNTPRVVASMSRGLQSVIHQSQPEVAASRWIDKFSDPSLPLVIDLGCGFGVSLLGLSSLRTVDVETNTDDFLSVDWTGCNYLGVDLSQLSLRYARGVASRWHLDGRIQFAHQRADTLLDEVLSLYPKGRVALILIQFPTPYRLAASRLSQSRTEGNVQLPLDPYSGFMVTQQAMARISALLRESGGKLVLQSNCEDVALHMKGLGLNVELGCLPASKPKLYEDSSERTKRTRRWLELGGCRALGAEWFNSSLLPRNCGSETELASHLQGIPVHRCMMVSLSTTEYY